ncbi:MAG: phosphatase PAP2 family protein [Gemmatimonadota bacterium]
MATPAAPAAPAGGPRPVDRLLALYALVSGAALLFPGRPAAWPLLAALHAALALAGLRGGPVRRGLAALARRWPRGARVAADWYPLLLVPALYTELEALNLAVWGGRMFDALVMGWEAALFGGQPSRDWAAAAPVPLLSELLHFSYLSYYLIIYLPPLYLYATGRLEETRRLIFVLMLTFVAHYVFFIYFPVAGPRYGFPPPGGGIEDGFFYGLAHGILEAGSSRGAAFPSSHVGVTLAATLCLLRPLPRVAPLLVVLTLGLTLGAIYGGFHYAVDALAGLLLGGACVAAAPRLRGARA